MLDMTPPILEFVSFSPLLVIKESMSPAFNKTRRHKVEPEMRELPSVMETQPTCINGSRSKAGVSAGGKGDFTA